MIFIAIFHSNPVGCIPVGEKAKFSWTGEMPR
jgi:hypothetical protein